MIDLRADNVRVAYPLFQADCGGSIPTSALQLFFKSASIKTASALNRHWHSRLPRFGRTSCRASYVAEFDGVFFASAIWTNPISSGLPQMEWMELNRMAVSPDAPKNTASRMLGWMVKDIHKRFPDVVNLISYQDTEVHSGTIYKAAGWLATTVSKSAVWDLPHRKRATAVATGPKQRWEKRIR